MKLAALITVSCLMAYASYAHAAEGNPPIDVVVMAKDTRVEVSPTEGKDYRYEPDMGVEIEGITITNKDAPHNIARIEHRYTTDMAIGEDGSWEELKGMETTSPWQMLSFPEDQRTFYLPLPNEAAAAPATALSVKEQKATMAKIANAVAGTRWQEIAKRCDGADGGPCYRYRSEDHVRITLHDGTQVNLTFTHPGGC